MGKQQKKVYRVNVSDFPKYAGNYTFNYNGNKYTGNSFYEYFQNKYPKNNNGTFLITSEVIPNGMPYETVYLDQNGNEINKNNKKISNQVNNFAINENNPVQLGEVVVTAKQTEEGKRRAEERQQQELEEERAAEELAYQNWLNNPKGEIPNQPILSSWKTGTGFDIYSGKNNNEKFYNILHSPEMRKWDYLGLSLLAPNAMFALPALAAGASYLAPGTAGGNILGHMAGSTALAKTLEDGSRNLFGQSAGDWLVNKAVNNWGVNQTAADMFLRPEWWINPTGKITGNLTKQLFPGVGDPYKAFSYVGVNNSIPMSSIHYPTNSQNIMHRAGNFVKNSLSGGDKAINTYRLTREFNKAVKNFDGTVGESYFHAPDKWYRITSSPEIYGIQEQGMNVTTYDLPILPNSADNFRYFIRENNLVPGTGENEGYWIQPKNVRELILQKKFLEETGGNPGKIIFPNDFRSYGASHGNRTQGSWQQRWEDATIADIDFPEYVLEGNPLPDLTIPFGKSRSSFRITPIEDVEAGSRIGFKTGEMPIQGLRKFRLLPNGRYKYEGELIPDKIIKQQAP